MARFFEGWQFTTCAAGGRRDRTRRWHDPCPVQPVATTTSVADGSALAKSAAIDVPLTTKRIARSGIANRSATADVGRAVKIAPAAVVHLAQGSGPVFGRCPTALYGVAHVKLRSAKDDVGDLIVSSIGPARPPWGWRVLHVPQALTGSGPARHRTPVVVVVEKRVFEQRRPVSALCSAGRGHDPLIRPLGGVDHYLVTI